MSARNEQSDLERVIEALIYSFFSYVIYLLIFGTSLPLTWTASQTAGQFALTVSRPKLAALIAISLLLGFGWGYVRGHDLLAKVLRRFHLTERTSRESVWNDVFINLSGTVQVELDDGRSVIGWLGRYSDTGDERSIFLEKAQWVQQDGSTVPIPGSGLLLTEKSAIKFVMFLDEPNK